jgi:2,3-bisphosphoglycerate-dependent phosphoglycerate mutase
MGMKVDQRFILLRHGQSEWNLANRFTGWTNVGLTSQGRLEAIQAAKLLKKADFHFDIVFTSVLNRAIETVEIVFNELSQGTIPVQYSWRLNERHYGCLQGLNKAETTRRLGKALVMGWRRSYEQRPPALELDDHRHPRFDRLYGDLPGDILPNTESLEDTEKRILPFWRDTICAALRSGKQVLIVAHGNTLRAMIRHLEQTPAVLVPGLDVPTGSPIVCQGGFDSQAFEKYELRSV